MPVRQWVLSLPQRLRYMLAWDHALCRATTGVFVRAVLGDLRRRAQRRGMPGGRGGAVEIIQRFGAALNLNVHVDALVLDGVYVEEKGGAALPRCRAADGRRDRSTARHDRSTHSSSPGSPWRTDLGEASCADPWRDEAPMLAGIAEASVQGRRALGERAGAAVRRCGASAELLTSAPWYDADDVITP